MSEPIRILHVIAGMGSGGAEMMIMNWYRNIDRAKVQFDFLLRSDENIYEDEIISLGGRIYTMPEFPRHIISNHIKTKAFFKKHAAEYAAIHVHANALIYVDALRLAKKYGIKRRIMHSHSTKTESPLYLPIHKFNKLFIGGWATDFFACSKSAGKWMFNGECIITKNAIDLDHFKFDKEIRQSIRAQHGWDDCFLVGHVGRFSETKNHKFLIEVFKEILKEKQDAKLALIGSGTLEKQIKGIVEAENLDKNVFFLGVKKNVFEYLSAFDVMVFPSIYEGLGIVAVEAQAVGLATLVSKSVPVEARITDRLLAKSLHNSAKEWAQTVLNMEISHTVSDVYKKLTSAGFNIKEEVKSLQSFYLQ